jgi:S-adenosylmethionine hydrolase
MSLWKKRAIWVVVFVAFCASPVGFAQSSAPRHPRIVFMTDFGSTDDSVSICKAVMKNIAPDAEIIDITHEVRPYSILDGARFLSGVTHYSPADTVFVVVIDPGVGSSRKPIVARSKRGQYLVLPDNGLLTMVEDADGIEAVREITNRDWMLADRTSSTFHGRDIFSPVAAHLASGEDWTEVGPSLPIGSLVRLNLVSARAIPGGLVGSVIGLDGPYGNVITNISREQFEGLKIRLGDRVTIHIGSMAAVLPFVKTFSDVPVGKPLLYIDSRGRLSLAINQGDFAKTYRIKPPARIKVARTTALQAQ